jgi:NADPH-dependent curcumin reductase CurA
VVGIAGSRTKLDWCRRIGFDETINYRTTTDVAGAVAKCCPEGVNVFFDNTGGPIHDAVMKNLAVAARVVICGRIAVANKFGEEDIGLRASSRLIATRATVQGLVVFDWWHRREEALRRLISWKNKGALQFKEDVAKGFESVPQAFVRMMKGDNLGKQLVAL